MLNTHMTNFLLHRVYNAVFPA